MESEFNSYEALEARVWALEHENKQLKEENKHLKKLLSDSNRGAERNAHINEQLNAQVDALEGDVERLNKKHLEVNHKLLRRALHAESQVAVLREALEKLARLGNGEHYGNSIGNEIAIKALTNTNERSEKMLKVVEAAVIYEHECLTKSQVRDCEDCARLYKAVREYLEVK